MNDNESEYSDEDVKKLLMDSLKMKLKNDRN